MDCPRTQMAKSLSRYETVNEIVRPSHFRMYRLLRISYMCVFYLTVCSTYTPDNGLGVSILCISSLFSCDLRGINKNSMRCGLPQAEQCRTQCNSNALSSTQ